MIACLAITSSVKNEFAMSPIREQYNPVIAKLLREHDLLPQEKVQERSNIQRRILFLMTTVKLTESEESFA